MPKHRDVPSASPSMNVTQTLQELKHFELALEKKYQIFVTLDDHIQGLNQRLREESARHFQSRLKASGYYTQRARTMSAMSIWRTQVSTLKERLSRLQARDPAFSLQGHGVKDEARERGATHHQPRQLPSRRMIIARGRA